MQLNWISWMGLAVVAVMLVPNLLWAARGAGTAQSRRVPRVAAAAEQVGRCACMALMILPLGVGEFGFFSVAGFLFYLFAGAGLLLAYLVVWVLYFRAQTLPRALALAVLPAAIFSLSALALRHWLLALAAAVFAAGHLWITIQNHRS